MRRLVLLSGFSTQAARSVCPCCFDNGDESNHPADPNLDQTITGTYMKCFIRNLAATAVLSISTQLHASDTQELAKASQNPVGNIISLPFEYNYDFEVGPEEGDVQILNLKPVYPVNIGKYNLINRLTVPLSHQEERFPGEGSKSGLGNITYQGFVSPAQPGKVIWGVGPAVTVPSKTDDRFGSEKWSGGPAVVVLAKPGNWLVGALVQHSWSFAGDSDDNNVNLTSFQYFINYNFPSGWYLTSTPTNTANWDESSSDRFTIPIGGGIGKLVRFGNQPVDFKLQGFYNAEKPDGAADWTMQFQFKFLFPKS